MVPYIEQQARVFSENVRLLEVVTQEMLNCQEVHLYCHSNFIFNVRSFFLGHRLPAKCKLNAHATLVYIPCKPHGVKS